MNNNDCILTKMIQQDMKQKQVDCHLITESIAKNPSNIEVKSNEVVYVRLFHSLSPEFSVKLTSLSGTITYDQDCVIEGSNNVITRHFGNVKVSGELPEKFLIQFVKVKF